MNIWLKNNSSVKNKNKRKKYFSKYLKIFYLIKEYRISLTLFNYDRRYHKFLQFFILLLFLSRKNFCQ